MTEARIHDAGYRRYTGVRLGPSQAIRSLTRHTAQRVMGLRRPARYKALPFLGVHLSSSIDGEVTIGPTALLAPARDAYALTRARPRDLLETLTWPGTWRMARRAGRTSP